MRVKILSGIYGYRKEGSKRVDPKRAGDVVEVVPEEAQRLNKLKVGVILGEDEKSQSQGVATTENIQNPKEGLAIPDTLLLVEGHFDAKSLMSMTRENMEKLAAELGVDVSQCKNKGEIAKTLAAVEVDKTQEVEEDEPELGVEVPKV